jgi:preprotein translocase subunit YajC
MILLIPVVFILMYLVLLRPQQQRVRRQQQLISTIGVGDRVVTAGGLIGRVVEAEDDRVWLELADDVVVEMLRMYVIRRLEEAPPDADELDDLDGVADDRDSSELADPAPDTGGSVADSHPAAPVDGVAATEAFHPEGPATSPDPAEGAASATAPGPGPTSGPAAAGSAGPEPDSH